MTKKTFFLILKGIRNVEFHADLKSVKKVLKKCTKSYKLNKFDNMSKSEKVHISVTSHYQRVCVHQTSKSLYPIVQWCIVQRKHRSIDASSQGCFVQGTYASRKYMRGRMVVMASYICCWSDLPKARKPVRPSQLDFRNNLLKLRHKNASYKILHKFSFTIL